MTDPTCADWQLQIKLAEKRDEPFHRRCKRIIKRYREERPDEDTAQPRRMNILWSNVQTLKPSIYGREPVPICERRFMDRDPSGRIASQILERTLRYQMPESGFHDTMDQVVYDYLLVARGVPWLRYRPIIGMASSYADRGDDEMSDRFGEPDSDEGADEAKSEEAEERDESDDQTSEKLLSAKVEVDYIHWSDFLHSKSRWWKEVEWIARRIYMSRKDLIDDFGEEIGKAVPLEMTPEGEDDIVKAASSNVGRDDADGLKKAIVYEIWDKPTRKVYTIAKGYDDYLEDPREDPLNLEGFWPTPRPLFGTLTSETLTPVADYIEYQDQALEIDSLTNRIDLLLKALKVAGVYDASQKQLARLLDEGHENKLIPVSNWAAFNEKGGLANAISLLPIKDIADVLQRLFEARDKIKSDLFEITGISDIIRGQSDPRETAEAAKTKGRWGTMRLQDRQSAVARICRDVINMMGEVVAEHFPDQALIDMSGIMYDEGVVGPAPEMPEPPKPPMAGAPGMLGATLGGAPGSVHSLSGAPGNPPGGMGGDARPVGGMAVASGQSAGGPAGLIPPGVHPNIQQIGGPGRMVGLPSNAAAPGMAQGHPGLPNQGSPIAADPLAQYQQALLQYEQDKAAYDVKKQQAIANAIQLLRDDKLRGFRIDIETDSTVQTEANEEKSQRTEFIGAVTGFLEKASQMGQMDPDAVPMLAKLLMFGVRGFRAGRDLESTIEEYADKKEKEAAKAADQPKPPPPEVQKTQMDMQIAQQKGQIEIQKAQLDAKAAADNDQRDAAASQQQMQFAREKAALEAQQLQRELAFKETELQFKAAELRMKAEITQREHMMKGEQMRRDAEFATHSHSLNMAFAQQAHEHKVAEMKKPKPKSEAA